MTSGLRDPEAHEPGARTPRRSRERLRALVRPAWPDVLAALLVAYVSTWNAPGTLGGVTTMFRESDNATLPVTYLAVVVATVLATLARRARPTAAVIVLGVACAVHALVLPVLSLVVLGACLIAVETAASRVPRPRAWLLLAMGFAGAAAAVVRVSLEVGDGLPDVAQLAADVAVGWVVMTVALLGGLLRRRTRERREQEAERVELLLAQQDTERRLAVADERNRIARDVHDVVGHSLAVIGMQAEGARAILAKDPAQADGALAVIGETSRRSVDDVRALVEVLRDDEAPTGEPARTAAASVIGASAPGSVRGPGIDEVPALLARLRAAGSIVRMRMEVLGEPSPTSSQCAFRVVREATTNALHHAPGSPIDVELGVDDDGLVVEVENGTAARGALAAEHGGTGLAAMRAEVGSLGGAMSAAPTASGGWRVSVRLPGAVTNGEE